MPFTKPEVMVLGNVASGDEGLGALHFLAMQPLRARVRNGRLVLDEPTELPDGEVIELVPLDDLLAAGGDYLDEDERRKLHASIDRGLADVEAVRTVESASVIERLRARASAR